MVKHPHQSNISDEGMLDRADILLGRTLVQCMCVR